MEKNEKLWKSVNHIVISTVLKFVYQRKENAMILEYLFNDEACCEDIENFINKLDVFNDGSHKIAPKLEITKVKNTNCLIIEISIEGNSLKLAKYLSKVNEKVIEYNPTVLINESSARFNLDLYPLVNMFERKLRTMLYLKSVDDECTETIKGLESSTFEKIYELLFTDKTFIENMRKIVNDKNRSSSRAFYIKQIEALEETTKWNLVVKSANLNFIRDNFLEIIDFRNDVMHAHNITYKQYYEAKKMFTLANIALEKEIKLLIASSEYREQSQEELHNLLENFTNTEIPDEVKYGLYWLTQ